MSPLTLHIEQINFHGPQFSPPQNPTVSVYLPSPPNDPIFDPLHSPRLRKDQTNRILIYPGSFNPPHRGHLHLLKHAFIRGTHGLHVIAAIVIPASDKSVARKAKAENGSFMFKLNERCHLWKSDLCFPPWAWVYSNGVGTFSEFSKQLIQAAKKDGYTLEFVPLYGAGIATPLIPPEHVWGCKTIIISDAARAAEYQVSSGRLEDFCGYTKWRGFCVPKDKPQPDTQLKADSMLKDKIDYTKATRGKEEVTVVVTCQRQVQGQTLTLRFLKYKDASSRTNYNDISSTLLREVMSTKTGVKLREALDWMALSADLLWRCKDSWIDKARLGNGCCIKFDQLPEHSRLYEEFRLYEKPPRYDDPPSLDELGLDEASEQFPPIDEPPSLESPALQEESPTVEEPQSPEGPPHPRGKKRRLSETGIGDDAEIVDDSAGGGLLLAEDAQIKKAES